MANIKLINLLKTVFCNITEKSSHNTMIAESKFPYSRPLLLHDITTPIPLSKVWYKLVHNKVKAAQEKIANTG